MSGVVEGTVVVCLDEPHGMAPEAVPALRAAAELYASAAVPEQLAKRFGALREPEHPVLLRRAARGPIAVLAIGADDPAAVALCAEGARLIEPPRVSGASVASAVAVFDRLRDPGGCPWDAEQTHDSLCQYLVEETYELLDAIERRDREALREELGDVLLQIIFHARLAAERPTDPFDIDDVAAELVRKLVGRHPHVFAGGDPAVRDAATQELRWQELKQQEKRRESVVDGVALGQPALALAAKLASRTGRAGIPLDLLPDGDTAAVRLFRLAATAKRGGVEPEGESRAVAKQFAENVRAAERAARAAGVNPETLEADGWRRYWPR
ncbi:XTP/dITP diphosphohydrolase [Tamaricihabitans halophyticus]|uniref:XTP/dITP diphosphohydrolase n=1 Tax=Tamaricihabitans halophyticus TaxID=1262583 RepID=A0A4R2R3Y1_9PSEU|nr:MazG family protein [Tamaricihabitans halophyticus]TCP56358.1 XTP/dITP diphosphohydrolase [Tamaricihabitans halophyticus]